MNIKVFEDWQVGENATIGIDGFTGNITSKTYSHKGAWSRIILNQLKEIGYDNCKILQKNDKWKDFDIIIIEMGMEYKGTLNLFGGANDVLANRLKMMRDYFICGGRIHTMEGDFPDINELIKSRIGSCTEKFGKLILFAPEWEKMKVSIQTLDKIYTSDCIALGDSHVLSIWEPGYEIHRYDGKTLYGLLNTKGEILDGLPEYIPERPLHDLKIYFGNIDIRHHLMRTRYPKTEIRELLSEFIEQIKSLKNFCTNITLVAPLPIENESRKLPKTGYYKGTPFYGTWQERDSLRIYFTQLLFNHAMKNDFKVMGWPDWYCNTERELKFDVMERPKSVHLNPEYYLWDLENNIKNKKFIQSDQNQESLFNL